MMTGLVDGAREVIERIQKSLPMYVVETGVDEKVSGDASSAHQRLAEEAPFPRVPQNPTWRCRFERTVVV